MQAVILAVGMGLPMGKYKKCRKMYDNYIDKLKAIRDKNNIDYPNF